ncbi:MAG: hypothetical protein II981_06485 [Bacteroidales bacterium]|nr:hypothetical protein [Bacteroidales bacterium]
MSDENKNGGSGNDKKDAGLPCCIEPIFVTFIIFACVTVILTWLFCLPVKRIIEQFSNEHCVHTFVLMIIILCVLSAGYIITLLCIRNHYICLLNIHRMHRMNEINRANQVKDNNQPTIPVSPVIHNDKEHNKTKHNDCNKHDDVSVNIALDIQNSIDVQTNKK